MTRIRAVTLLALLLSFSGCYASAGPGYYGRPGYYRGPAYGPSYYGPAYYGPPRHTHYNYGGNHVVVVEDPAYDHRMRYQHQMRDREYERSRRRW